MIATIIYCGGAALILISVIVAGLFIKPKKDSLFYGVSESLDVVIIIWHFLFFATATFGLIMVAGKIYLTLKRFTE